MALTPTTWDPSTAESNAVLSGGDLTYRTTLYYANRVQTRDKILTGKVYWELTGDSLDGAQPYMGVDASGSYEGGLFRPANLGGVATGDVLGFAMDADGGTLTVTKNGAAFLEFPGLTRDAGEGWSVILADTGASGSSPVQWTANFGQSAFAYPIPNGYTAGPVRQAYTVDGIEAEGPGVPTAYYPPVVSGIATTDVGAPALVTRGGVDGIDLSGQLGTPRLRQDQVARVVGIAALELGVPTYIPPVNPNPDISAAVAGIEIGELGTVSARMELSAGVAGVESTEMGTPLAGIGFPVAAVEQGADLGVPFAVVGLHVAPVDADGLQLGSPRAGLAFAVAGVGGFELGEPRSVNASTHTVYGIEADGVGLPSAQHTFPVLAMPGYIQMGRPILRSLPC